MPMKNTLNNLLGYFFLGIGILGTYLPILPGVVFLIIAAYFFMKSNPYLYNKIINNEYYGKYIKDYLDQGVIPIRIKLIIFSFIWGFSIFSMFYFLSSNFLFQIIILVIAILSSLVIINSND